MKKIHERFYFTDDDSIQFVYNDGLFYIESNDDQIVLNKGDVKDLIWFIENVIKKGENET